MTDDCAVFQPRGVQPFTKAGQVRFAGLKHEPESAVRNLFAMKFLFTKAHLKWMKLLLLFFSEIVIEWMEVSRLRPFFIEMRAKIHIT